jgi:hypothetical protein
MYPTRINPSLDNAAKQMQAANDSIAQAVADLDNSKLPYYGSLNFPFTVVSTPLTKTLQIDASFWFFIYGLSIIQPSQDPDVVINSIAINTMTNILQNDWPTANIYQYTGYVFPFPLTLPANTSLNVQITNGATTANNNMTLTFVGVRVPTNIIERIKSEQRAIRSSN